MCRFLAAENLPATYREQVVQFILQNSAGAAGAPAAHTPSVDPFTGGSAYVPGASRPPVTGGGFDPFTGERYCQLWQSETCALSPARAPAAHMRSVGPFTGGSTYVPGASRPPVTGGGFDPLTGERSGLGAPCLNPPGLLSG